MRARVGTIVFLGVLALALPIVLAAPAAGGFRLDGPMTLPEGSQVRMADPLAIYAVETQRAAFVLTASEVVIRSFENRVLGPAGAVGLGTQPEERTWRLTDVRIETSGGDHAGFAGIYPAAGAAAELDATKRVDVESAWFSQVPKDSPRSGDGPDVPFYGAKVEGPHVRMETPGRLGYVGPGAIKITGFDLVVKARENATSHETGFFQTSAFEETTRWLHVEFADATIEITSRSAPLEIVAKDADIRWDGEAWLTPTSGEVASAGGTYGATGDRIQIDGAFSGTLAPVPSSPGSMDLLGLSGDLRATSLRHQPAPAPIPLPGIPSWAGLLAVGVTVVGGAAAAAWARGRGARRGRASASRRARAFERRAMAAADQRRWELASDLLDRAIRVEPSRAGALLCEKGVALYAMDRFGEALDTFERASARADDGEAELWAARCSLRLGHADHAETNLVRALEREDLDWDVLRQISSEDEFEDLRRRPSVDAALDAALERHGGAQVASL